MKSWLGTLKRNKLLKLLSVLLAIALWFAVSGEERTETTINMALELTNLQPNLMVTSDVPPAIQVRVVGPRSIVNSLADTRLSEIVDLNNYKSGRHTFYLGPKNFAFPRGVQVIRVQPNPINLTLSTTITKVLPIKPILENNPPEGYEIISANTKPLEVTVKGPSSELAELDSIPTHPIDLSHLKESIIIATDLDFNNFHLSLTEPVPIMADIQIRPQTVTRTISSVPVMTESSARVSPLEVTLTVKGPWPKVQDLKAGELQAQVDTRNLSPGRHHLNIFVQLPEGVSLVNSRPPKVTVTLAKKS